MNSKNRLQNLFRGWLPQKPTFNNTTIASQASIMSEREKAYKRKVASVLLGVSGVFAGWAAAGYAYVCFTWIGVTPYYATICAIPISISVATIIWIIAFNLKRLQQYFSKETEST